MRSMETRFIRHRPQRLDCVHIRIPETGRDIAHAPDEMPEQRVTCPECQAVMMYRGIGQLRDGRLVYVYECVHSHREVYSLSVIITNQE